MILNRFSLDGQVALVTGASRGLGQAMALALAEAGADVAVTATTAPVETAAGITAAGRRTLPLSCDLGTASVADLDALINRTVAEFGRLDILVNNAGIIRRAPALDSPKPTGTTSSRST